MKKIYKIVNIALIFVLIGVFLGQDCAYSDMLRVPMIEKARMGGALHEVENVVNPTISEIAMLGDMIDDARVIKALPRVRACIKNPAYLHYAMRVYLYDSELFERLIREGVSEEIIDDIGWSLVYCLPGIKIALDNNVPFSGLWEIRNMFGFGSGDNTASLFENERKTTEEILKSPFKNWIANSDFVYAFKNYPDETKVLIDEFKLDPNKEDIQAFARLMSRDSELCKKILNDTETRHINGTTITAIGLIIDETKKPIDFNKIKTILTFFDKKEWDDFCSKSGGATGNIKLYLSPFFKDETQARRLHNIYPYNPYWFMTFEVLTSDKEAVRLSYKELVKLGYPENEINFNIIQMYQTDPEFFKWALSLSNTYVINKLSYLYGNGKDKSVYLETAQWIKNSGLIKPDVDEVAIKDIVRIYIEEICPWKTKIMEKSALREKALNWAISLYKKGFISLANVEKLYKARLEYEQGTENAIKSGVKINLITSKIAEVFEKEPYSIKARSIKEISSLGAVEISDELCGIADRYIETILSIKKAGFLMPYLDAEWLELAEKEPSLLNLWKQVRRYDGFECFYNRLKYPSASLQDVINFVEKLVLIAQDTKKPLSRREIIKIISRDRVKYVSDVFLKDSYDEKDLKLLLRDLKLTLDIYELKTGFSWFPFITNMKCVKTQAGTFHMDLCLPEHEIKKLENEGFKVFTGKHGRSPHTIVTIVFEIKGNDVLITGLQTNMMHKKGASHYASHRYKDSLAIGLFVLEQMFEDARIIMPLPATVIEHSKGHINPNTAYNVYYKIPHSMGYQIQKLQLGMEFKDFIGLEDTIFWVKEVHKDTPRPVRNLFLRYMQDLTAIPVERLFKSPASQAL